LTKFQNNRIVYKLNLQQYTNCVFMLENEIGRHWAEDPCDEYYVTTPTVNATRAVCQERATQPLVLLTLKYAKHIWTRYVNCWKVVQLNGIMKRDRHTMPSPFSNSNPRLFNGQNPQSPQNPVVFDVKWTKDKGELQFITERIIAREILRRR